ncbi:cellulase family glycosylhydrolase [Streptomyces sp. NPDC048362]|uniref:cellulase family glycosylhydrolase n=1 Tax=Streptomyces sp. NPDC048362 TaxID=3365539 RepID=UPI00371A1898
MLAVATATLTAGGLDPVSEPKRASDCTVNYSVMSRWDSGFVTTLRLTNKGTKLNNWTLTFDFTGSQRVVHGWNAKWSQSGTTVTARNESWNDSLGIDATVVIGFLGSTSEANVGAKTFKLNGSTCGLQTQPSHPPTVHPLPQNAAAPPLHVAGNKLIDPRGRSRRLLGVNRSGAEYMCINGYGIFDGPVDDAAIKAIADWKGNAVRIPLNEECWLGLSGAPPKYAGTRYIRQIKELVARIEAHGMTPILDLHWSYGIYIGNSTGCTDRHATCQKPMPDAQYSPSFWSSVARVFKGDQAVAFDLFNEPYPDRTTATATQAWQCWLNGGTCPGISYKVAGMQDLVNVVRAAGARNVLLVGGLAYSNDLSQWLVYKPQDPADNLIASYHVYPFNACTNDSCWNSTLSPIASKFPVVATELGEMSCAHTFVDSAMKWFDDHDISYLGWTWNTWDCSSGPSLISDYSGTPTPYGIGLRNHLRSLSDGSRF